MSASSLLSGESPAARQGSQQTARRAIEILVAKNERFHEPSGPERDALLIAFAMRRKAVHGAAFDVVRMSTPFPLIEPAFICENIDALELIEVKSTNRTALSADFTGYFFALTTAELLVAQTLDKHFRFAFVNIRTGDHIELTLQQVFARARGIYPTWSIRF